jgi:PhnB protein
MSVLCTPHLNFRGDARAALAFYHSVFGGEQTVITYAQMGNVQDPAEADHVVWGQVTSPNGFRIMAYDVPASTPWNPGENPFFVSVRGDQAEEITALWEALSEGANVLTALAPSAWSPLYGMLSDRFGITWILDVVVESSTG